MAEERVPRTHPSDLTQGQRRLYDAVTGGERASQAWVLPLVDSEGHLEGPFGPLLHAPHLGMLTQKLGAGIRSGLTVDDRTREIATLWCAVLAASEYEIEAHRRLAGHAGVSAEEIDCLTFGDLPNSLSQRERVFAIAAACEKWDDITFNEATHHLGLEELTEAIVLGGYYRLLSTLLDAFNVTRIHE